MNGLPRYILSEAILMNPIAIVLVISTIILITIIITLIYLINKKYWHNTRGHFVINEQGLWVYKYIVNGKNYESCKLSPRKNLNNEKVEQILKNEVSFIKIQSGSFEVYYDYKQPKNSYLYSHYNQAIFVTSFAIPSFIAVNIPFIYLILIGYSAQLKVL